ncbi:hypothetical protein BpHYR1_002502 [Brachionus plicatilis]|uniref:Uncharacterized protein n=1 Tax=Brachionus plicatilis TaxID=10195 RepID=A0A3M7QRY1_BRAPC|nr:hypothetical protein BpHYR1_002502 [Brachionus plicatilis]
MDMKNLKSNIIRSLNSQVHKNIPKDQSIIKGFDFGTSNIMLNLFCQCFSHFSGSPSTCDLTQS